jgi:membrane protein DedA with SNARE-associated domain
MMPIRAGRPALAVAKPVVAAVIVGDQLAYFSGAAVTGWWRRRRPGRTGGPPARRGAAAWLTAAMPSLAGGAGMRYRSFAFRVLVMRVPWLAVALNVGVLAASSLTRTGHVAGIVGIIASVVVAGLLAARHGPGMMRGRGRRSRPEERPLSSTVS